MPTEAIVQLVTDLGSFGFILYLVHRTQTHTIPRLASTFQESLEKQRQDFKEMVYRQREDFSKVIQREQEIHAEQTAKIVKAVEDLARDIRSVAV